MQECWICNQPSAKVDDATPRNVYCPRCGPYSISGSLAASDSPIPKSEKYRLSFWCRQRALDGRLSPTLDTYSICAIAAELPLPKPNAKADILLSSLGKLFPKPGLILEVDWGRDYPLACAEDGIEMRFYFRSLKERGFLAGEGKSTITWAGWDRINQMENTPSISKQAFVAFKFSDEMLSNWKDSIGEAIIQAGFDPILANFPEHNDRIDAKIISDIRKSRFVVADVTGSNAGVYFEAGYALGLGRPVIWTCRSGQQKDMHFDTKQYNHILWKDYSDLRDQLRVRIVATI